MQTLQPNTLLQGGKYKIVRFISAGGFGCTYEGVHVMLNKRVAIKEFFVKDFCNRDETTSAVTIGITSKTALVNRLKDKFIEEAQYVSTLKHPHIVSATDVFAENGTAYYVMDYIDGPSLNDIVKRDGALREQKALKYILQIADALKYVHSQNRLHLDIKPGNIMVDDKDNAMLIDFGTSKQYDEIDGENTSTLMGKTPGYAPLEQMGNDIVEFFPSTDIYALGATLYKLLTGTTPISASLLASGEELDPIPTSISENVRNAVYKAMQINKRKRPQSMEEFAGLFTSSDAREDDESKIIDLGRNPFPNMDEETEIVMKGEKQENHHGHILFPSILTKILGVTFIYELLIVLLFGDDIRHFQLDDILCLYDCGEKFEFFGGMISVIIAGTTLGVLLRSKKNTIFSIAAAKYTLACVIPQTITILLAWYIFGGSPVWLRVILVLELFLAIAAFFYINKLNIKSMTKNLVPKTYKMLFILYLILILFQIASLMTTYVFIYIGV